MFRNLAIGFSLMIDAPYAIQPTDAPQPVQAPTQVSTVGRNAAVRFDTLAHNSTMPTRQAGDQSYRSSLRQFEANWDYDPALHAQSPLNATQTPSPTAPGQPAYAANQADQAEQAVMASLMQGTTLMQQTGNQLPVIENQRNTKRYSDIAATSETVAVESLRTSPDGQSGGQQREDQEERRAAPGIGLASRAAKKEWLRCVSSTPRPMRPTPHLPKLG